MRIERFRAKFKVSKFSSYIAHSNRSLVSDALGLLWNVSGTLLYRCDFKTLKKRFLRGEHCASAAISHKMVENKSLCTYWQVREFSCAVDNKHKCALDKKYKCSVDKYLIFSGGCAAILGTRPEHNIFSYTKYILRFWTSTCAAILHTGA